MDPVHVGAVWLHSLAMVIVLGYYGILARIVVPALRRSLDGQGLAAAVPAVERRAAPIIIAAVVVFILTGLYLLLVDGRFTGFDSASPWPVLMIVKHMAILVMLALAVLVDRLARSAGETADEDMGRALDVLVLAADGATALGALALLLTAVAQLS